MKLLTNFSVLIAFVPLFWVAGDRSSSSNDFETANVNCEQYCPDFETNDLEVGCSSTCSENTFVSCPNEEVYVDDIPFDTEKVVENVDLIQNDFNAKKAEEQELTIVQLFFKWVALLFRLN